MDNSNEIERVKLDIDNAYNADQDARKDLNFEAMPAIDAKNTKMLRAIVAKHGWPTISTFGKKASHQAWLLAQHADHDPEFQAEVLSLMWPLLKNQEIAPNNYAYLYDRLAVKAKQQQFYGTQGYNDGNDGWMPFSINGLGESNQIISNGRDLAVLNARRRSMKIEPERFEDYFAEMNGLCAEQSARMVR